MVEREWFPIDPRLLSVAGRQAAEVPAYTPERIAAEELRADLVAVVARRCYQHAAKVADDILADFKLTRKTLKEKR